MDDLISRQAAITAICNACEKIDCDKMDKCEKLQLLPANNSEIPNSSDTISRQQAIEALDEQIEKCDKSLSSFDISMKDEYAVKVERASLVAFREILEYLPPAQPAPSQVAKDIARIVGNENDMRVIAQGRIKGHWVKISPANIYECSECGKSVMTNDICAYDFCHGCGADMEATE